MKNNIRIPKILPFRVAAMFTVIILLNGTGLPGQDKKDSEKNITVTEAISELENHHSVRILFDRDWFTNDSVSTRIIPLPLEKALSAILSPGNMEAVELHGNIIIVPREQFRTKPGEDSDHRLVVGNPYESGKYTRATIKGKVVDGLTKMELIGVIVYVEDLGIGTTTSMNGEYSLELPVGEHLLTISYIGYESDIKPIKLVSPGELNVSLLEESQMIDEVTIFAKRDDSNIALTQMSIIRLDSESLYQLPANLGERDIIKSLTLLPGVQSLGEFGTGFHVRGGSADQNLILVEGVPLFNSSHLFGLTSLINPDMVSDVTLIKGGIPARYGERSSSVMDIRLAGNSIDKFSLNGGIGLLNSRLSLKSPLPADNGYVVVGGRSSYSNWLLNRMPDEDLMNSSARFYDVSGIGYVPVNKNNTIRLFGYYSHDGFAFGENTDYNYSSMLGSLRLNSVISQRVLSSMLVGYSGYNYNVTGKSPLNPNNAYNLGSEIGYNSFKWNINYYHNPDNVFEGGINAIYYNIDPGNLSPGGSNSTVEEFDLDTEKAVELAGYLNGEMALSPEISLETGLRYTRYYKLGPGISRLYEEGSPRSFFSLTDSIEYGNNEVMAGYGGMEPRLSLRYHINPSASIKMSYNRIHQYINLVSNTSLPTPADVWYLSNEHHAPVKSDQIALGIFKNLFDNNIETSVEVYYKNMQNIVEPKNNAKIILNPAIETSLTGTRGYSYGAEFYINKVSGMLHGWISYTFSQSYRKTDTSFPEEQINLNNYFPANFDKPHNLVVNANVQLNRRWRAGGTFTYNTGRPVTLPEHNFAHDGILLTYFSDRNKYRLPDFHRLDVSISYDGSLRITRNWKSRWSVSIVNVYGRKNVYSSFYEKTEPSRANNYQRYSLFNLYIIGRPLPTITYNFTF